MKLIRYIFRDNVWLWFLLTLSPNLLSAQKVDSEAIVKNKFYYWGELGVGIGYGDLNLAHNNRGTPGGLAYGVGGGVSINHNFLKGEVFSYQYFPVIFVNSGYNNNSQTYSMLLGRQLPIAQKYSINIASGISHIKVAYDDYNTNAYPSNMGAVGYASATGVPLEISLMRSWTHYFSGTLTYREYFNNKALQGNVTLGITLGKIREKLGDDKRL